MSETAQPVRFNFENVFEKTSGGVKSGITEHDLEEARRAAYAEGFSTAQAEAQKLAGNALSAMAVSLDAFCGELEKEISRLNREAGELALVIARKLARALLDREPLGEVTALIDEAISHIPSHTRIVVRVNDTVLDEVKSAIEKVPSSWISTGTIIFDGTPDVPVTDCRIEWADGQIIRDMGAMEDRIEQLFANHFSKRKPQPGKPADKGDNPADVAARKAPEGGDE